MGSTQMWTSPEGGTEVSVAGRRGREWLGLVGANALARLRHVTFDSLVGTRVVLGSIGVGETGTGGVVTGFDGGKPSGTHREAGRDMEIEDESLDTREVICAEGLHGRGSGAWWS